MPIFGPYFRKGAIMLLTEIKMSAVCILRTCVEKWCMTAIEMQASKEAVRKGRLRASDTNAWKPLSAQIWIRALLRSQPN